MMKFEIIVVIFALYEGILLLKFVRLENNLLAYIKDKRIYPWGPDYVSQFKITRNMHLGGPLLKIFGRPLLKKSSIAMVQDDYVKATLYHLRFLSLMQLFGSLVLFMGLIVAALINDFLTKV